MARRRVETEAALSEAEAAMNRFFEAQAVVTEAMGEIFDARRAGTATEENEARLKELSTQWTELMQKVGDVQKRLILRWTHLSEWKQRQ